MHRKLFGRRTTAVLAATALVGAGVGVFGATGAGAAGGPQTNGPSADTQQSDCTSSSTLGGTRTLPFATTLAGSASDSNVYPTGATVGYTGAIVVTIPAQVVAATAAGSTAQGATLTQIGIVDEGVSVAASNTVSGGFSQAGTGAQVQTPDTANGNTFTIPVSGSVVSSGVDGDQINFTQGALHIAFNLTVNGAINIPFSASTCVVNNQNGVLDAGEAEATDTAGNPTGLPVEFGFPYPAAPSATTALLATNPTVTDTNATVSSAAATSQVQVPIAKATPQAPGGTAANIVSVVITPDLGTLGSATITNTGLVTYTPQNASQDNVDTFTITATDALGKVDTGTLTLTVKAGDATSALVDLTVNPGSLLIVGCGSNSSPTGGAPCAAITMTDITLDGSIQTSTGAIGQMTVVDARGLPLKWTLSAQLDGPLVNQSPPNGTCNTTSPTCPNGPDGQNLIPADHMTLKNQVCAVAVGGDFSATTAGTAGTMNNAVTVCTSTGAAIDGTNGGTFTADAGLSLVVDPDIYVGSYQGTINFLLS